MRVECYVLDLYCDVDAPEQGTTEHDPRKHYFDEFPHQFTGHTQGDCYRKARAYGWLLGRRDLCPTCSGKRGRK